MTSPVSAIEAIEKAMEGVKHSSWFMSPWHVEEDASAVRNKLDRSYICNASSDSFAAYIATCNPVAMRQVLALARRAEALQRENAEKAGEVKIKPLEWPNDSDWNIATSELGRYVVRPCLATNFSGQWLLRRAGAEDSDKTLYPSEDAAKAAAQADYDQRLRSELSTAYRRGREDMREEAAAWHDAQVADLESRIDENNAYALRNGRTATSEANKYCRDMQNSHRLSAAAIRKMEA